jgi:hypothetical protein
VEHPEGKPVVVPANGGRKMFALGNTDSRCRSRRRGQLPKAHLSRFRHFQRNAIPGHFYCRSRRELREVLRGSVRVAGRRTIGYGVGSWGEISSNRSLRRAMRNFCATTSTTGRTARRWRSSGIAGKRCGREARCWLWKP